MFCLGKMWLRHGLTRCANSRLKIETKATHKYQVCNFIIKKTGLLFMYWFHFLRPFHFIWPIRHTSILKSCVNLFSPKHTCQARVPAIFMLHSYKKFFFSFLSLWKTKNTIEVISNHFRKNLNTRQDCIQ